MVVEVHVHQVASAVGENGDFIIVAVQWTTNYRWAEQCKAATRKARAEILTLRSWVSCRKPEAASP